MSQKIHSILLRLEISVTQPTNRLYFKICNIQQHRYIGETYRKILINWFQTTLMSKTGEMLMLS